VSLFPAAKRDRIDGAAAETRSFYDSDAFTVDMASF
jgi:hypothetical protein